MHVQPVETEIYRIEPRTGYYRCRTAAVARRYPWSHGYLHRIVHGPVPDGFEIHHCDENRENNVPENLVAMEIGAHMTHHRIRSREIACVECGQPVQTTSNKAKYCGYACKSRYGRRVYGWTS